MTRPALALSTLIAFLVALLATLTLTGTAAAKGTKCGQEIVADWFDNGRIDRIYPLHCYEEAIDAIPSDIRDYADAAEVINRALQAALNGRLDPRGGPDPTPAAGGKSRPAGGRRNGGDGKRAPEATGSIDTSGPSSLPIPLLVLGGISLALLAAGGYGYLSRRRRGDDGDGTLS